MLRVVPDTNVLISAFMVEGNEYRLIENGFKKEILLLTSLALIEEFKEVALRPRFGFTKEEIDDFIDALLEVSELVVPVQRITGICRDPDDERLLEAAVEGKADYIVSGDKDLLVLKSFRGVKIVTAAELLRNPNRANATNRQEPKKRGDVRNI